MRFQQSQPVIGSCNFSLLQQQWPCEQLWMCGPTELQCVCDLATHCFGPCALQQSLECLAGKRHGEAKRLELWLGLSLLYRFAFRVPEFYGVGIFVLFEREQRHDGEVVVPPVISMNRAVLCHWCCGPSRLSRAAPSLQLVFVIDSDRQVAECFYTYDCDASNITKGPSESPRTSIAPFEELPIHH